MTTATAAEMKKAKLFITILIMCLLFMGTVARGEIYKADGYTIEYALGQYSCTIKKVNVPSTTKRITVPGYIDGLPLGIGEVSFRGCKSLEEIVLEEGVDYIGEGAFQSCKNLKTITLPETIHAIGAFAFEKCSSLIEIEIPDSVQDMGFALFWDCTSLQKAKLPKGITCLPERLFQNCASLKEYVIPDTVTTIEDHVFEGCTNLERVVIPNSVKIIQSSYPRIYDSYLFSGCSKLNNVVIPDSVEKIGWNIFYNCDSLTNVTLPKKWTEMPQQIFNRCDGLIEYTVPVGIKKLNYAFDYCSNLRKVRLPEGLETINGGFRGCKNLTEVNIPKSVKTITYASFLDCPNLRKLTIPYTVQKIEDLAFGFTGRIASDGKWIVEPNFTAYVHADSSAEKYCIKNKINYKRSRHVGTSWKTIQKSTVFEKGIEEGTCKTCGKTVTRKIAVLTPTISLSDKTKTIKKSKSFVLTISNLARGDSIKSIRSSKTDIVTVKKVKKNQYRIRGVNTGKTTVTVLLKSGKKANCRITVRKK